MNDFLKTTFDSRAALYNEVRPRYPAELFDVLEKYIPDGDSHLLEIGAGTGQATKSLAERGYQITAVELGEELALVAREELKEFNNAHIITSSFEDAPLLENSFDLIYCATAFHWIKPEVRFSKTHTLLKEGGHLAIIYTNYVSDKSGDEFLYAAQEIFEKYNSKQAKSPVLPSLEVVPDILDERLFKHELFQIFPVVIRYTADDYAKLLGTFSSVLAMDPSNRNNFLAEVRSLSDREYSGEVILHLDMSLTAGRKI